MLEREVGGIEGAEAGAGGGDAYPGVAAVVADGILRIGDISAQVSKPDVW